MERDYSFLERSCNVRYFNSHAHVERDLTPARYFFFNTDFNSHAHVERDHSQLILTAFMAISTHTLTWSVTGTELTLK